MPIHGCFRSLGSQRLDELRTDNILSEALLLQKLEMLEGRAGVVQVLEIGRSGPVSQVGKVCDEGRFAKEFLGCEVIQVEGVRERLDKLEHLLATKRRA